MSDGKDGAAVSPEDRLTNACAGRDAAPVATGQDVHYPEYWVSEGRDQLFAYLRDEIFPLLAPPPYGRIDVTSLSERKPVYLFREDARGLACAGKFRFCGPVALDKAWALTEKEYANLEMVRGRLGTDSPYKVVAPLGKNRELAALLVTERARGKSLDHYLARAADEYRHGRLFARLGLLANFFAALHDGAPVGGRTSADYPADYLAGVLGSFKEHTPFGPEAVSIEEEAEHWWPKVELTRDYEVLVHRDATPTNFLFHRREVTGIDFDRMRMADRCWDLGFIAAELKHHFTWRTGDPWAAEPFIGHFLREYAAGRTDGGLFSGITRRNPLFMGMGLVRIARNEWLDEAYRRRLLIEARECLKYGR